MLDELQHRDDALQVAAAVLSQVIFESQRYLDPTSPFKLNLSLSSPSTCSDWVTQHQNVLDLVLACYQKGSGYRALCKHIDILLPLRHPSVDRVRKKESRNARQERRGSSPRAPLKMPPRERRARRAGDGSELGFSSATVPESGLASGSGRPDAERESKEASWRVVERAAEEAYWRRVSGM
ncbi:hypothetical protein DFH11DRAFT_1547319 [Phellopilus nigrolimitatus]|nr:hypothetical protein DFH11DRAFT_1547319 [Phellopilus nigrolimitatus]